MNDITGKAKCRRIGAGIAFAAATLIALSCACGKATKIEWRTAPVEKGDLSVEVTASGTVNPHHLVAVGTQVSGIISHLFVDFNSHVKKGQLIATLDTTQLAAGLQDAAASLRRAQAQDTLTHRTAERTKALFDKGLAAQADVDQAQADYLAAKAATASAQAQLDRAKINLSYARIYSPINGVVVNRAVDNGQTVAASFNTPTLFTLADDLARMQVQASVDEADIGQVKIGQEAPFTVDAYPNRSFTGTVSQIRLQAATVENVVSYTVMIDVDNPDLALMPGMTANVTISVEKATNVLKVPLAALKFMPMGAGGKWRHRADSSGNRGSHAGDAAGAAAVSLHQGHGGPGGSGVGDSTRHGGPRVFVLGPDGKPKRVPVTVGLSNSGFVAVEGDLAEGQQVIVGVMNQTGAKQSSGPQQNPLGGMPRRF